MSPAYRQAADVDSGRDFHAHMDRLIRAISRSGAGQSGVVCADSDQVEETAIISVKFLMNACVRISWPWLSFGSKPFAKRNI